MFGSSVLEVAIGIMFVYLLLSLVCTVVNEGFASVINKRGEYLFKGIKNLLNDPNFTGLSQQLYSHGLVQGISQNVADSGKPDRPPSYMSADTFALALIDILSAHGVTNNVDQYQALVDSYKADLRAARAKNQADPENADLKTALANAQKALDNANADLTAAKLAKKKMDCAAAAGEGVTNPWKDVKFNVLDGALAEYMTAARSLAASHPDPMSNLRKGIQSLPEGHTKESLLVLLDKTKREVAVVTSEVSTAEQNINRFQVNVEHWFNGAMDSVSGWYKRWTQLILLLLAIATVTSTNADTIALAKRLSRDSALRASVVAAADSVIQRASSSATDSGAHPTNAATIRKELLTQVQQLNLPLGWTPAADDPNRQEQIPIDLLGWLLKLCGLSISVAMVSLGAPFWFDMLSKIINVRGAGIPPGASKSNATT